MTLTRLAAALGLTLALTHSASAASCGKSAAGFEGWIGSFKSEAAAQGISQKTVNAALSGVSYDARVIRLDRNQKHFEQLFDRKHGWPR